MPAHWKLLRRGEAHDFTILKIREDTREDPRNGSAHPRVVIECADWVNVLALTPEKNVVMVRQYRNGVEANTLELPGGVVDFGEAPLHAAARELEEETGYRGRALLSLGWVHPNPATHTNRCHIFLAEDCERVNDGHLDSGEDILVELHPLETMATLVRSGAVTHSLVLDALYLAEHRET